MFYLFHRFIKEVRNEISPDLAASLLDSITDLLAIQVDLPELDSPETQDLLTEAIKNPGIFDAQIYLFETAGILNSLFFKDPAQSETLLKSIVKPLMGELPGHLQAVKASSDVTAILKIHHIIMALGNVAKGFPDLPSPLPEGYILPPLEVFREIGQTILVCLEQLNVVKGVRDAVRLPCPRSPVLTLTASSTVDAFRFRKDRRPDREQHHVSDSSTDGESPGALRTFGTRGFHELYRFTRASPQGMWMRSWRRSR